MKFKNTPVITTPRLTMHAIRDCDSEELLSIITSPDVSRTYLLPDFASREEAMKLFDRLKALSESDDHFVYGIYLGEKLIGFINDVSADGKEAELGYVIHPDCWNRGYCTEVLAAAIEDLFAFGCRSIKTGAFEENPSSLRVMEKCGMTRMDETEELEYRGAVHRCIYYVKENGQNA